MRNQATMPRWPAWAMAAVAAACAWPAMTTSAPGPVHEHYQARGQEPGWQLRIHNGRLDFRGADGSVSITELRPEPRPTARGRRYVTGRLTVDIADGRCTDATSGDAYAQRVSIVAVGRLFRGCGGERRRELDA